jgi:PAS domain S-box-containing protein
MKRLKTGFKRLRIQRKISVAVLLTCGTALLVTALAIFVVQLVTFRNAFEGDLDTTAAILANYSASALNSNDLKAVTETLRAVRTKDRIVRASILRPDGSEWGAFERASVGRKLPKREGFSFVEPYLVLNRSLALEGGRTAQLQLVANYQSESRRTLLVYAAILGTVLVVSVLFALILSRRLQHLITRPILALATTAENVANHKDYSLRAQKLAFDEVGQLTDAFNEMLAKTEMINQRLEQEIGEHQRTEEALHASEQFLIALVESLPQSILRKDLEGRFTFVNQFFCRTLGKPMEAILGKTDADLFPPELAAKYRRDDEQVLASQKPFETVEVNVNAAGEKVYVQVIKTPLRDADNHLSGLQVVFWDVTERKRAEEAVEKMHKELLLASRQAGMAEVATGVLHNVGNVLNSVNVSVNVLHDGLRRSRVCNLSRAIDLFRAHRSDLAAFLSTDPKGQVLPGYLENLAVQLTAERDQSLREMEVLSKNMEHVKEIVAMQQSYAKLCGLTESVSAADLVEDAIRMNLGAFERHGIQIVRQYGETPPVLADRHKVLQILVNLMRNAKYALDERGASEKRLAIRIAPSGARSVVIEVEDNGVGIARENLTRIFGHGFTTKRDGHGFGLHSGALAAKEMGGCLTAHSDGPGHGAVFSLELPIAQAKDPNQHQEHEATPSRFVPA